MIRRKMLPSSLKYDTKTESMRSRTYKSNISPQNGQGPYSCDHMETIIVNIPTGGPNALVANQSGLKLTLQVANGQAADNVVYLGRVGGQGIIKAIAVYSGSNLIENINQYGALARIMSDLHFSPGALAGKNGSLYGCSTTREGERTVDGNGATLRATFSAERDMFIPLWSIMGVLGGEKYFPLYAANAVPIRIEITLAPPLEFLRWTEELDSVNVVRVEYIASMCELGDPALAQLPGSELSYHTIGVRNYQSSASLPGQSTSTVNFPIAAKVSSLKSLFVTTSYSADVIDKLKHMYSGVSAGLQSYTFSIGSKLVPAKAPRGYSEFISEFCKAGGVLCDPYSSTAANKDNYWRVLTPADIQGAFCVGLDVEEFSCAKGPGVYAGMNTNSDDIHFKGDYNNTSNAAQNINLSAFSVFDMQLSFSNGTCVALF
jgi:hypothetical protein